MKTDGIKRASKRGHGAGQPEASKNNEKQQKCSNKTAEKEAWRIKIRNRHVK